MNPQAGKGMILVRNLHPAQIFVVESVSQFVRKQLMNEPTGHDWWHAERVLNTAAVIAKHEGANPYVVALAALLHDVGDAKFTGDDQAGPRTARRFLSSLDVPSDVTSEVCDIIGRISYKGAAAIEPALSLEGKCVQDADRLDAIGAIGIARVFAYGGYIKRPIHDPDLSPAVNQTADEYRSSRGTSINHFHEKLLLVQGRLKTRTAIQMAKVRHDYMVAFLDEFSAEWRGIEALDRGRLKQARHYSASLSFLMTRLAKSLGL